MGFWEFVTVWYNVFFTIPLAFVLLFAILQLVGIGLEIGEAEPEADIDVEGDLEVDSEVEVGEPGLITSALGFLNVGKVPLMVVLMTWFASWGATGLVCNKLIRVESFPPLIVISLVAAFAVSLFSTRYFAAVIAKIFPESEPATRDQDLIGRTARVVSGQVTPTFGRATVQTPDGYRLTIPCRVREGSEPPMRGDEVILVDYDPNTRTFEVVKAEEGF